MKFLLNKKDLNWDNIHNDKITSQTIKENTKEYRIQTLLNKMTDFFKSFL